MKKYLFASAIGAACAGASAGEIYDSLTGLTWDFTYGNGQVLPPASAPPDSFVLARESQFQTLVSDLLGSAPLLGGNLTSPAYPAGFDTLFSALTPGLISTVFGYQYANILTYPDGPIMSNPDTGPLEYFVNINAALGGYQNYNGFYTYGVNVNPAIIEFSSNNISELTETYTFAMVQAMPEPSTDALMLGGLGLIAWMQRRHDRKAKKTVVSLAK